MRGDILTVVSTAGTSDCIIKVSPVRVQLDVEGRTSPKQWRQTIVKILKRPEINESNITINRCLVPYCNNYEIVYRFTIADRSMQSMKALESSIKTTDNVGKHD